MGKVSQIFVGHAQDWREVQALFEDDPSVLYQEPDAGALPAYIAQSEWYRTLEERQANPKDESPCCMAGALLGFSWFDSDTLDYVNVPAPLTPAQFFKHQEAQRVREWGIQPKILQASCERQDISRLNFVVHIGDDYLDEIPAGKRASLANDRFIVYLGRFSCGSNWCGCIALMCAVGIAAGILGFSLS